MASAFAADEEDGAGSRVLFGLMQAVLAFGVDGPGGFDGEAGADEGGGQGVPGLDPLVGEHDGEDAVRVQHAMHLAEGGGHLAFVVLFG